MKPLRVDNWANYLLQKLQALYETGDQCDLILLFSSGITIKVHSLVVNACTNYFQTLENRPWEETNSSVVILPSSLKDNILEPIIRFMYSGILELSEETFYDLYDTAKFLKLTLLTKLLDARKSMSEKFIPPSEGKAEPKKCFDSLLKSPSKNLPLETKGISFPKDEENCKDTKYKWPKNKSITVSYDSIDCLETNDKQQAKVHFSNLQTDFKYPHFEDRKKGKIKGSESKPKHGPASLAISSVQLTQSNSVASNCDKPNREENVRSILKTETNNQSSVPIKCEKRLHFIDQEEEPQMKNMKPNSSSISNFCRSGRSNPSVNLTKQLRSVQENFNDSENPHLFNEAEHQKILSEVRKKYPDMVKGNNLRLRIVQCASHKDQIKIEKPKGGDNKVAYLVLKAVSRHPNVPSNELVEEKSISCRICSDSSSEISFATNAEFAAHIQKCHNQSLTLMCEKCLRVAPQDQSLDTIYITRHEMQLPEGSETERCSSCKYVAISQNNTVSVCPASSESVETGDNDCFMKTSGSTKHQKNKETSSNAQPLQKNGKSHSSQETHNDLSLVTQPSSEFQALSHVSHSIAASIAVSDPDPDLPYEQNYQTSTNLTHPTITVEYSSDIGTPIQIGGPSHQYTLVASQYQLSHVGGFETQSNNGVPLATLHDGNPVTLVNFPSKIGSGTAVGSTGLLDPKSNYLVNESQVGDSQQLNTSMVLHKQSTSLSSGEHNYTGSQTQPVGIGHKSLQSNIKISSRQVYLSSDIDPNTTNHYSSMHNSDIKRALDSSSIKSLSCEEVGSKFEQVEEMLAVLHQSS